MITLKKTLHLFLLTFMMAFFCFASPSYANVSAPIIRDLTNLLPLSAQEKLSQGTNWQCLEIIQVNDKYNLLLSGQLINDYAELPQEKLYLLLSISSKNWAATDSYLWKLSSGCGTDYGALPIMQTINDSIWLHLQQDNKHVIFKITAQGTIQEKIFSNIADASLTENGAVGYCQEKNAFIFWNGENEEIYNIKTPTDKVRQISELDNCFYYIDDSGNFYRVTANQESLFANLQDFSTAQNSISQLDSLDDITLFYADHKLWISINDWRLNNPNLLCYNSNTIEATAIPAGNVHHLSTNNDGSVQLLWSDYFPVTPNPLPIKPEIVNYTITKDDVQCKIINDSYEKCDLTYTDSGKSRWSYRLQNNDILFIKQNSTGTTVGYSYKLALPQINVIFQGESYSFDQAPYFKNNHVMLPLRGIASLLGATVQWQNNTVYINKAETSIQLNLSDNIAFVNGERVSLDSSAEIKSGRTMVPLRFISEHFSFHVNWNNSTQTVEIDSFY